MQQIFIVNPKGGCGKTMLSTQLAAYYAKLGLSVALCDRDPQQSSLDWVKTRPKHFPKVEGVQFYKHKVLTNRFDIVIHDMPAGIDIENLGETIAGHKVLIPVLPSPTDIKACLRFLMALNRSTTISNQQIGLVANRVNVRTNYFKVLITFLNQVNLPLVGYLRDTQNYVRTASAGIGIFDLPQRAVNNDLLQWQPVLEWLAHDEVSDPFKQQISDLLQTLE